jgi:hypothetical protein
MTDEAPSKGYGAIISTITAFVALLSAIHPDWRHVVALSAHTAELTTVLTGAFGTFGAAVSHPPAWIRGPWDDLKYWVASHFRKAAP